MGRCRALILIISDLTEQTGLPANLCNNRIIYRFFFKRTVKVDKMKTVGALFLKDYSGCLPGTRVRHAVSSGKKRGDRFENAEKFL